MSTRIESADHCIIINGVLYPKGVLRACIEGNLLNVWEDLERTIPLVNSVPYNEITHVNTGSPFASISALSDFVKEHFFFKRIKNLSELINDVGYLTSETDPTVPGHVKSITTTNISQWNTAYGWGNHAGLYPLLSGSYDNPIWVNSLAWSKITGKPTSLSGYGITDAYTQTQIQNYFAGIAAIGGYNKANWDAAYAFTSAFNTNGYIQNQSSAIQTAVARINGQLEAGQGRFTAWNTFGTGKAVEVGISSGLGHIIGYDRTNSTYETLVLQGGSSGGTYGQLVLNASYAMLSNVPFIVDGILQITLNASTGINIKGTSGGWGTGLTFQGNAGTQYGGFWGYGTSDTFNDWRIGDFNTPNVIFAPTTLASRFNGSVTAGKVTDVEITALETSTNNYIQLYQQAGTSYIIADKIGGGASQSLHIYTGGAASLKLSSSGILELSRKYLVLNNAAEDRKIEFNRTGGKQHSIEHDTTQIYLYNNTDTIVPQRWLNTGQVAFDYYVGTGNRLAYLDQYGLLVRSSIDPANILTTASGYFKFGTDPSVPQNGTAYLEGGSYSGQTYIQSLNTQPLNLNPLRNPVYISGNTVWHAGNDGTGSGLDADLLNGLGGSSVATPNSVAFRNSSGHLVATFFNMTNTSVSSSPMKSIIGKQNLSGDDFLYEFNATTVKDFLGLTNAPTSMPTLQQVATAGNTFTGTLTLQGTTFGNSTINSTGALSILNSGAAQQILTSGVLASDNYLDASSIPTNGIYSKGNVIAGANVIVGSILGAPSIGVNSDLNIVSHDGLTARRVLAGGLLVSDVYLDASSIPTNGIYSKGVIKTSNGSAFAIGDFGQLYYRGASNLGLELIQTNDAAHSGYDMFFNNWGNSGYEGGWAFGNSSVNAGVAKISSVGNLWLNSLAGSGNRLLQTNSAGDISAISLDPSLLYKRDYIIGDSTNAGDLNTMLPDGGFTTNYYGIYTNGATGFAYGGFIKFRGFSNDLHLQYDINHGSLTSGKVAYRTTNTSGIGSWKTFASEDWVNAQVAGNYVPYTGATTNVDLNSRSITATGIASLNVLSAGAIGVANGNILIARSSDGANITDMTTDGNYSITNNAQGSGHLWNISGLERMKLTGTGELYLSGPSNGYYFSDRSDNSKVSLLYSNNAGTRLFGAPLGNDMVVWDYSTGTQTNLYHQVNSYGSNTLSSSSYNNGNYEAFVNNAQYLAGARPGYGFHIGNVEGIYLYAEGDNKLRVRNGSTTSVIAYEAWVNSRITAIGWADVLGIDPTTQGTIPNISGADYSDTRILFTNNTIDNPYELVAGHHNDASNDGFSLYDQINDATRFWFNSSGETYLNDGTINLPNIANGGGNFVTWNNGSLRYRNAAQVLSDIGAQAQLNGTGFVKVSGTTVSYDNTAYTPQANVSGTTDFIPKFTSANAIGNPGGQYRLGGWLNLDRYSNTAAGINFYGGPGGNYNTWQLYMAAAGQTSTGIQGNITAPTGTYVTSWALRSLIENAGGYGWTWESMANGGTIPTIAAELNQDGNFLTGTLKITKFLPESVQEGAIIVDRTIPNGSGNENARGFKDNTTFARNGYAYCSYDAVAHFASGGTYPHYTAFQMRPTIQGSVNSVEFGATYFESSVPISRFIGLLHEPPQMYGNTLTDSYAVKVEPFGSVGINNWVIYSSDPNIHSYHGGDFTAGYFNQSSSDSENSTVDQIITTAGGGDNYFRKVDKAHFLSELGITSYWSYGPHNLIQPYNPDVTIDGVNFDNHRLHLEADTKINTGGTYYSLSATDNVITNVDSSNLNVRLPDPGDIGQRGRQLKFRQLNTQSEIYFFDADGNATHLYDYFDGTTHWGVQRLVNAGNNGGTGAGYEWVEIISMDMTSVERGWQWVIVQQGGSLESGAYREPI